MSPRLSVCMIARDEEEYLPRCLESLAGAADEVVLVDTGSSDRTPLIAASLGARVLRADWHDDFSEARNHSLDAATGTWCLVLDADEELTGETRNGLVAELARAELAGASGVSLLARNLSPPGDLTSFTESPLVRLFRRDPRFRYEGRIHEQIAPSIERAGGLIAASAVHFLHHGYTRKTAQGSVDRARRNLRTLERAVRDDPKDAYLLYQLGATLVALGDPAAASRLESALALDEASSVKQLTGAVKAAARMKLAQLALGRAEDGRAEEEARRCLALEPGNVPALQILALTSLAQGRSEDARWAMRALLSCPNVASSARSDVEKLLRAVELALLPIRRG